MGDGIVIALAKNSDVRATMFRENVVDGTVRLHIEDGDEIIEHSFTLEYWERLDRVMRHLFTEKMSNASIDGMAEMLMLKHKIEAEAHWRGLLKGIAIGALFAGWLTFWMIARAICGG